MTMKGCRQVFAGSEVVALQHFLHVRRYSMPSPAQSSSNAWVPVAARRRSPKRRSMNSLPVSVRIVVMRMGRRPAPDRARPASGVGGRLGGERFLRGIQAVAGVESPSCAPLRPRGPPRGPFRQGLAPRRRILPDSGQGRAMARRRSWKMGRWKSRLGLAMVMRPEDRARPIGRVVSAMGPFPCPKTRSTRARMMDFRRVAPADVPGHGLAARLPAVDA